MRAGPGRRERKASLETDGLLLLGLDLIELGAEVQRKDKEKERTWTQVNALSCGRGVLLCHAGGPGVPPLTGVRGSGCIMTTAWRTGSLVPSPVSPSADAGATPTSCDAGASCGCSVSMGGRNVFHTS